MNNNYYPYFNYNIPYRTAMPSGIIRSIPTTSLGATARTFNFSSLLNGASRTLNVINQAIPVINQAKPVWNNMKTMFRVAKEFNAPDTKEEKVKIKEEKNEVKTSNTNNPSFFI